jgi:phenylalanyl-tRNA synthetase beta chain
LAGATERAAEHAGTFRQAPVSIILDQGRLNSRLGVAIPAATVTKSLQSLGCAVRRSTAGWTVKAPSFRRDVKQDVDLTEELARLWGYGRIPATIPEASLAAPRYASSSYARAQQLKQQCAGLGLSEVATWSLLSAPELAAVGLTSGLVEVTNPLSLDHAVLRPTLLAGLLRAVARNLAQGAPGVWLFELGQVFSGDGRAQERPCLGFALSGTWEHSWRGSVPAELFRLKGIIEQVAGRLTRATLRAETASFPWIEPGQGIRLWLGDKHFGYMGEVAKPLRESHDCEQPVWLGEVSAELLLGPAPEDAQVRGVSHFPAVKRDLSFVVDRTIAYAELAEAIRSTGAPLASEIKLIDRYAGRAIPESKHSVTLSIDYRDPARTLTAEEVDRVHGRIVSTLTERFGAQLR